MANVAIKALQAALLSGSRSKNYASQIRSFCRKLSKTSDLSELSDAQRTEALKLASLCRATTSAKNVLINMGGSDIPAIDQLPEFKDLFCKMYYPVLEDGKRTVGFWSIVDSATLSANDVHEWVKDSVVDKKTKEHKTVPVPFGSYWNTHRPDYELYAVASDRAQWNKKIIDLDSRKAVNTAYGSPPVTIAKPEKYCDETAKEILWDLLERTITDEDGGKALQKRKAFILDAGSHLLALRDFGSFRCRKIFCFTSTNGGQGSGKSLLHESLASLVPVGASCTVPTTLLAGNNLLPLYSSSVCILTEAPSTSNERYTSEDVKAFADAGWKTAEEKYVAKRPVYDNSLKLLSSNHTCPLPIDSAHSRRVEFYTSAQIADGGTDLRKKLDEIEEFHSWTSDDIRKCIGWAILDTAQEMLNEGYVPCAVARRTIDASHLLSRADYEYFVIENGKIDNSYADYKEFRAGKGFTWCVDSYRFEDILAMSHSVDSWIEQLKKAENMPKGTDDGATDDDTENLRQNDAVGAPQGVLSDNVAKGTYKNQKPVEPLKTVNNEFSGSLQYKSRVHKAKLESDAMALKELYELVSSDVGLKYNTGEYRQMISDFTDKDGTISRDNKKNLEEYGNTMFPQIFPTTVFDRYSRKANIIGYTGLVHVDFDDISEKRDDITSEQVRDLLSEIDGFVMSATSSGGDGTWAIFNAGDKVTDYHSFIKASDAIISMCEEALFMRNDDGTRRPTTGRKVGYDADCKVAKCVLEGTLPKPFEWKLPKYSTISTSHGTLAANIITDDLTTEELARRERFLEKVVEKSCSNIIAAPDGERHNTAVRAIANIVLCCREKGITPLSMWGRKVKEACMSCGLPRGEIAGLMSYWRQESGVRA